MSLKNASFFALIGTVLAALLLVYNFISAVLNVVQGLVPAVTLFSTLIYAIASVSVAAFFFVFYKQN